MGRSVSFIVAQSPQQFAEARSFVSSQAYKQYLLRDFSPITATQCVLPRWKAGWKSWVCCGPSPDQGLATTTPALKRCSAQLNTGPITQGGHSPAWKRHACGWRHLWIGTTTGTATAASSSLRHTSDTVAKPWRSAATALSSTNRHVNIIHDGGHDLHVAGVNQRWSGSIHHPRK